MRGGKEAVKRGGLGCDVRRLRPGDGEALARFYNGLSEASRRTFRPLGWQTRADVCAKVVEGNVAGTQYDLVAVSHVSPGGGSEIVGWSFVWDLGSEEPNFGLGVADAWQGQGVGGALMDRVLAGARGAGVSRVYLIVVQDNLVAYGMYARRGFVRYGELVGEDGLAYFKMVAELGHG